MTARQLITKLCYILGEEVPTKWEDFETKELILEDKDLREITNAMSNRFHKMLNK